VPLRLIMDSIIRVTFPTFSRLQHDMKLVGKAIETSFFGLAGAILPITITMLFFIQPFVDIIPRYGKWEPAILAFYLFAISSFFAAFSTPLTNAINAIGKIKVTLFFMIGWTILTWIFTFLALPIFGFTGAAVAHVLISSTIVGVIIAARRFVFFRIWDPVKRVILAGSVLALYYVVLFSFMKSSFIGLTLIGLSGGILYGVLLWSMEKVRIRSILSTVKK
jgi:O-antigen/teichoic acid export membrane protein